jgi:(2Fe-2S) ferredoxin
MRSFSDDGPEMMVCVNKRFSDLPSCGQRGSEKLIKRLEAIFAARGIACRVRGTVCQNACERGPNMRLFPHRALFFSVTEEELPAIVERVAELVGTTQDDSIPPPV